MSLLITQEDTLDNEQSQQQPIPMLCEMNRKPQAIPKNLGPCIIEGCLNPSKYVCPKCQKNYCSIACYKAHSDVCVNEFYAENVKEELKGRHADDETQKKMRNLLKEYKEQLDLDREEIEVPKKTLERLQELKEMMKENELDLDDLTLEEQHEFASFIKDNNAVNNYIKPWKPWWIDEEGLFSLFIEELAQSNEESTNPSDKTEGGKEQSNEIAEFRRKLKQKIAQLQPFKSFFKGKPSEDLPYQLLNIMYGFVLVLRLYNGDIEEDPLDYLNLLASISQSLNPGNKILMGTVQNAINEVISNAIRVESADITRFISAIQEDIVIILNNKVLLLECLFRLFDLLHEGQKDLRDQIDEADEEGTSKSMLQENMKKLGNTKQKIIFFLSYTKDCLSVEQLQVLRNEVQSYKFDKEIEKQDDKKLGEMKKLNLLL